MKWLERKYKIIENSWKQYEELKDKMETQNRSTDEWIIIELTYNWQTKELIVFDQVKESII